MNIKSIIYLGATLMALALGGCATSQLDEQAVQALCANPASNLDNQSQRTLLGAGYKALASTNFECAERLLLRAQSLDSKDPYAALNLGVLYHQTQRLPQAREAYERAMSLDKVQPEQSKESAEVSIDKNKSAGHSAGEIARKNLALIP